VELCQSSRSPLLTWQLPSISKPPGDCDPETWLVVGQFEPAMTVCGVTVPA
jgi:hypothetical protein